MKPAREHNRWVMVALLAALLCSFHTHGAKAQTSCSPYCDADLLFSSVVDHLQYPIPAKLSQMSDGHINFANAVATNSGGSGTASFTSDEVRFAAAYTFCEHLMPDFPTPVYSKSGNQTADAIANMSSDRSSTALRSVAASACFDAVAYRTACPSASKTSFQYVGASVGCYDFQYKACMVLKGPAPEGLGLDPKLGTGDTEADYALTHCDTDGLSLAMIDKIRAYRCNNPGWMTGLATQGDAGEMTKILETTCDQSRLAFDNKLAMEKERLQTSILTLLSLRGTGTGFNPLSRQGQ